MTFYEIEHDIPHSLTSSRLYFNALFNNRIFLFKILAPVKKISFVKIKVNNNKKTEKILIFFKSLNVFGIPKKLIFALTFLTMNSKMEFYPKIQFSFISIPMKKRAWHFKE